MLKSKRLILLVMAVSLMVTIFIPVQLSAAPMDWVLTWSDEFNAADGTGINTSRWAYDPGTNPGNAEKQYYTTSTKNIFHRGGNLVIKAFAEAYGGMNYTSGRIRTYNVHDVTFGKIEMRAMLPSAQKGVWPAFWLLGSSYELIAWPDCGEIDILEYVGKLDPNYIYGTLHGPGYSGGAGVGTKVYCANPQAYHTYAIEWERDVIRWYFDGVQFHQVTAADLAARGLKWMHNHDFYLILNLAIGGLWPGDPDATTVLPQEYVIDYVRVYKRESTIPVVKTLPARIEAEDYINKSYVQGHILREDCSEGGLDVGFIHENEWMDYTVNVPATADYRFSCRVAGPAPVGNIQLRSGSTVLGTVAPVATGDYQAWTTTAQTTVRLNAGQQTLRIFFNGSGFNINWFELTASGQLPTATPTPVGATATPTPVGPTATPTAPPAGKVIPGKIEAESYDAMSGIQTETCSEGTQNIGWIDANDWMDYNVNVQTTGSYSASFRVSSPYANTQLQLRRGTTVLATVTVPNTGGWQAWATASANVNLTAGSQTLRVHAATNGWNFNWMNFALTGGATATPTPTRPAATATPTQPPGSANLARGKTATASSTEDSMFPASASVDGDTGTRWSSAFSDPQWLRVDLGASYSISRVVLRWEAAYARSYQVQTSTNGTSWTTAWSTTTGAGGVVTATFTPRTARYVRMYGTERSTQWGYSLWEFEVYQ